MKRGIIGKAPFELRAQRLAALHYHLNDHFPNLRSQFHPSGYAFGTGSEDKSSRLFDIRSDQQVAQYSGTASSAFTSCALSLSGRHIMCGSDDNDIHYWDTLKTTPLGTLRGHENRITSLSMSPNGMALASCSWDNNVRIWV